MASQAVAEIIQENDGSILNYLKKQAPADTPHGISQEVMDTYIRSCGKLHVKVILEMHNSLLGQVLFKPGTKLVSLITSMSS